MGQILESVYNRYRGGIHLSLVIASSQKPFFPHGEIMVNMELSCSWTVIDHVVEEGAVALRLTTDYFEDRPVADIPEAVRADVGLHIFLGRTWSNNRDFLMEVVDTYHALVGSAEARALPSEKREELLANQQVASFYVNKRGEFLDNVAVGLQVFDWRHNQPVAHFLSTDTSLSAVRGRLFDSAMSYMG